jgi:2'-aminobiphenyl-2,3-diol 1,2-dioxygenase, small subunit
MISPPLRVHRLIEGIMSDPENRKLYDTDPEKLFDRFAVEPVHRAPVRAASVEALAAIGVHPSMIFKLLIALGRSPAKLGSARYYLDRV